ncbi:hypothetical protein ACF1BP_36620 [Streptomyces sp. NPDC014735]|uniref:hypothetical protein n=1 Tax=unclassified Streptomyces TaxID=2593676 RepID=UPI0036F5A9AA
MNNANELRAEYGVAYGAYTRCGSAAASAGVSSARQRRFAVANTPFHECGTSGRPCSFSHSHNGSGPSGPSVNSNIRSCHVNSSNARSPGPPGPVHRTRGERPRVTPVTSRTGNLSYSPLR